MSVLAAPQSAILQRTSSFQIAALRALMLGPARFFPGSRHRQHWIVRAPGADGALCHTIEGRTIRSLVAREWVEIITICKSRTHARLTPAGRREVLSHTSMESRRILRRICSGPAASFIAPPAEIIELPPTREWFSQPR